MIPGPVHARRPTRVSAVVGVLAGILAILSPRAASPADSEADRLAFFENRIRPLFVEHCHSCHATGAKKVRGGLKLDTREEFLKGGTDGPIVVGNDPARSSLLQRVRTADPEQRMPPPKDGAKALPATAIADLERWVAMGAPFPATPKERQAAEVRPWAFAPVQNPPTPSVLNPGWVSTSVDRFILAAMEKVGKQPGPRAEKLALIRRVTYGLTGLPPTPEAVDAFLKDTSPTAFATVVDRLLNSRAYGEHWGRHWLDVVRYADTAGDTADYPVGLAWRYRNYVIDAFNTDKPYDEFLREQIAGDVMAAQGPRALYAERVTATGFLAISRRFGFDSENYHHLTIQDTLDTLGQTVLGLSLGCARCHDHKFDPVSMKDYYGLYGIFSGSRYAFPGSEQKSKLRAMVPLVPPEESQVLWRDYDRQVAALAEELKLNKAAVPNAVFRSLHDPDGDFEIQKDAAGGSYGVIVPPWISEGRVSVTLAAQSPFRNVYPAGKFGAAIAGGEGAYRLFQTLHPPRHGKAILHANLDFRVPAETNTQTGIHRFSLGRSPTQPAIELVVSLAELRTADGRRLCTIDSNAWHNLQIVIDPVTRTFQGTVSGPAGDRRFGPEPMARGWTEGIAQVQWDGLGTASAPLPPLDLDNFVLQPQPIRPAGLVVSGKPAPPATATLDGLTRELQRVLGMDGDLEWQTNNTPPAAPWNPGPKSVVSVAHTAQSPFENIHPRGRVGVSMPSRAAYDGVGLTLPSPWKSGSNDTLAVAFDFQCDAPSGSTPGSWRFYVGHGPGKSAAAELFITGADLTARSGTNLATVARLQPGGWHQVQLLLNLRDRTFNGTIASPSNTEAFQGTLATGWDGVIDYAFIDSYGHRPGERPAIHADNFAFQAGPFPPLSAPPVVAAAADRETRRVQAAQLRQRLAGLTEATAARARELSDLLVDGPCEMTYGVVEGTPHPTRIQLRGEPDRPGDEAPRGFIRSLGGGPLPPGTEGSGRKELAGWLTDRSNPLTARVMVNRIWLNHFGRGLVTTPNDFGVRGQPPTHPELLDHLATRFMESGWSMKTMHRLILLSSTYQQAATDPASGDGSDYTGFRRRRLAAEEIRDSILAITGALDPTPGRGHTFPSPVTASFSQHAPFSAVYDHNRRSIYLMNQRIKRHPFLALFDGPDPNASTADRRTTTVPTQALYFLNSSFVHEKAALAAERLHALAPSDQGRVDRLWHLIAGRPASGAEQGEAAEFLAAYREELARNGTSTPGDPALAAYVRVLLGSNDFLHID